MTCIKKDRIIVSGGCSVDTNEPSNYLFEINSSNVNHSRKLKSMTHRRWGHMACFIHPYLYLIGGFEHKDVSKTQHSTLKFCEKYNIDSLRNEGIAQLNQARAFSGISVVNNKNIFIFGGFYNDTMISSIEKYDTLANVWITYQVKLFYSLAKMAALNFNNNIILLGGIDEEFQITNKAIVLDLSSGKWTKLPEMQQSRTFNNSAFLYNSCIYAIGGNSEATCEKFDFITKKWKFIDSYSKVMNIRLKNKTGVNNNELYSYCFSLNFLDE